MIRTPQTHVFFRFVVALSLILGHQAYAETGALPDRGQDARAWLRKIQTAAEGLDYSGTFVYQQGNQMRTSRITHIVDGKREIEKLEILDGKPREYIRTSDEVICYIPETKTLLVEKQTAPDVFPAILAANPESLAAFYKVEKADGGRVAGRDCQAIALHPNDDLRYGYKLWADKKTGLLLRAQTLNEKNEVVEQISFTHVAIGEVDREQVVPSYADVTGWRIENAVSSQADLSGWTVTGLPPGFKKVREVKRLVSDAGATAKTAAGGLSSKAEQWEVSQMVFSDGLAAISVFIEPGAQSRTEGSVQQGALNIVGRRQGDFWLTIVGEVPSAAVWQVANSIEFKPNNQ